LQGIENFVSLKKHKEWPYQMKMATFHTGGIFDMRFYLFALTLMGYLTSGIAEEHTPTDEVDLNNFSVYGHIEKVVLIPGDIEIKARLDTGASKSSINAQDIELIGTKKRRLVRFVFDDRNGNQYPMTLPLVEKVAIKQASGRQVRYVVEMGLCVGDHYKKNHFTLSDRSRMTYPVLVGRNFLKDEVLVSSKQKLTSEPNCELGSEKTPGEV
jgi:hypothetical protein